MNKQPKAHNKIENFISKYYDTNKIKNWIKTHLLVIAIGCFGLLSYHIIIEIVHFFNQ